MSCVPIGSSEDVGSPILLGMGSRSARTASVTSQISPSVPSRRRLELFRQLEREEDLYPVAGREARVQIVAGEQSGTHTDEDVPDLVARHPLVVNRRAIGDEEDPR